ncbi:MAG: rRNA methyltransferase, partial [Erysipelotrichaceae bacterium]|nr:rRNA methyltransferase [Erysipelotrichaceae bacterium]
LGVIGRRNDIKFHITPQSLDELQVIQKGILESASKIVNDDGYILYSTCTLNKKENDKQVDAFLNEHSDFKLIRKKTVLNLDGDLFFEALLKKV